MRLFVAVALPADAAGELDGAVAPLRLAWPELRWTGRDAWHLTLAFLGEVDEGLTGKLGARLERAAAAPSLDVIGTRRGEGFSLRWIMVHMIEEYARHNGHADLLREAIDGVVGE